MFPHRLAGLLSKGLRTIQTSNIGQLPKMEAIGKELSTLFKQGKHDELIQKIDSSEFKAHPEFLKLKSLAQELLGEQYLLEAQTSLHQAQYFSQKQDNASRAALGLDP